MENEKIKGKIIKISGSVVDVRFPPEHMPSIYEALTVSPDGKSTVTMEVERHVGEGVVRCIMMSGSEGLYRGMEVTPTGEGISVPVGKCTLGRMFDVT